MGDPAILNLDDSSQPQNISMGKHPFLEITYEGGDLRDCMTKDSVKGNTLTLNANGKQYKVTGIKNNTPIFGYDSIGPFSENLQGFYEKYGTNIDWFSGGTSAKPITSAKGTIYGDTISALTSSYLPPNVAVTIDGGAGNDSIVGSDYNDKLIGGAGNDTLIGGEGDDFINAGADNNSIVGGQGNDTLIGGAGDDIIISGSGGNSITGGAGNNTLVVDSESSFNTVVLTKNEIMNIEGVSFDSVSGAKYFVDSSNKNNLLINHDKGMIQLNNVLSAKGTGAEVNINGDNLSDVAQIDADIYDFHDKNFNFTNKYTGTVLNDSIDADLTPILDDESKMKIVNKNGLVIDGAAGNDTIIGSQTNDKILGGAGNDSIVGSYGNDTVIGGEGENTLDYTECDSIGNNTVIVTKGEKLNINIDAASVSGGLSDLSIKTSGGGEVVVKNLLKKDTGAEVYLNGENLKETALIGVDSSYFVDGEKLLKSKYTGTAIADSIDARLVASQAPKGLTLDGGAGNDSIWGSYQNDKIMGGEGNDSILGGQGHDSISSVSGDNYIDGGDDNDSIVAGAGNDTIISGTGDNFINAGDGNNFVSVVGGSGYNTIIAGAGNDTIISGNASNSITGGAGENTLIINSESWAFNAVNLTKNEIMNIEGVSFDSVSGAKYFVDSSNKNNLLINHDKGMVQLNNVLSAKGTGAEVNINGDNLSDVAQIITDIDSSENYNAKGKLKTNKFTGTILSDSISGSTVEKSAMTAKGLVIDGGEGNDTLVGSVIGDSVVGGLGDDVIYGGEAADTETTVDTIVGGLGNDILNGGTGDNKYVFNLGDGNDSIVSGGSNQNDAAVFTKGTNIEVGYNDNDLIIEYSGLVKKETVSNEITVKDYDEEHGLQKITVGKTTKDIKDYMAGDNSHTVTSLDETTSVKILENGGEDTLTINTNADSINAFFNVNVSQSGTDVIYEADESNVLFINSATFEANAENALKYVSGVVTEGPQPYGVNIIDASGTGIETLQTTAEGTLDKEAWFDAITAQVGAWLSDENNNFTDVYDAMTNGNSTQKAELIELYNVTYTASLEP